MTTERRQKKHPNLRAGAVSAEKDIRGKSAAGRQKANPNLRRGGPGRPKGVPNKATTEAKAFAESVLHDPDVQERMREDARKGRLPPPVMTMLMGYAWGKPKERIEIEVMEALHLVITDEIGEDVEPRPAKQIEGEVILPGTV